MINLAEGKLVFGERDIRFRSGYDDWQALAADGFIEKREDPGNAQTYYYHCEVVEDSMRFGVSINLREQKIHLLVLHWLDGPCTSKGWDGVSEQALRDEYRLLLNFVKKRGGPSDSKGERTQTWRFKWGEVDVSYAPRDFVVAIFLKPK